MQTRSPPPVRPRLRWTTAIRTPFLPLRLAFPGGCPAGATQHTPRCPPQAAAVQGSRRGGSAQKKPAAPAWCRHFRKAQLWMASVYLQIACPRHGAPARACGRRPGAAPGARPTAGGRTHDQVRAVLHSTYPPPVALIQNRAQAALPDASSAMQTTGVSPHDTGEPGGGRHRTRTSPPSTRSNAVGAA